MQTLSSPDWQARLEVSFADGVYHVCQIVHGEVVKKLTRAHAEVKELTLGSEGYWTMRMQGDFYELKGYDAWLTFHKPSLFQFGGPLRVSASWWLPDEWALRLLGLVGPGKWEKDDRGQTVIELGPPLHKSSLNQIRAAHAKQIAEWELDRKSIYDTVSWDKMIPVHEKESNRRRRELDAALQYLESSRT